MKKRGQLTLLIIIGILVVGVIGAGVYGTTVYRQRQSKAYFQSEATSSELNNVKQATDNCVKDLTKEALFLIGDQGGHYLRPNRYYTIQSQDSQNTQNEFMSYYYYNGEILTLELKDIQNHLSAYIEDNLLLCIRENSGNFFNIEAKPRVISKIQPGIVDFEFQGELIINSKEGHSMTIDLTDYRERHKVNLYGMQEVANYLTETHNEDKTLYCLSCLVAMLEERGLFLDYYTLDENNMIVIIIDRNNEISEEYYFSYLNRYTGQEESSILNEISNTAPEMPGPE